MTRKIEFTVLSLIVFFLSACNNKLDVEVDPIKELKIEQNKEIAVGDKVKLTVTTVPEKPTEDFQIVWESSDPSIIEIDEEGMLVGLKAGEAVVTASVKGKEEVFSRCEVTVTMDMNSTLIFEDQSFKNMVLLEADKNQDGELQYSEAVEVRELYLSGKGVKSIKGIEQLTNLEILLCSQNLITEIDVSQNKKLRILDCNDNRVGKLNVTGLENLEELYCRGNLLQEVDLTTNINLKKLNLSMNIGPLSGEHAGIRSIDVSKNIELEHLDLYFLNISELDVTQNKKLKWLDFSLSGYGNTSKFQPIETIDLSNNTMLEHLACAGWGRHPGKCLQSLDVSSCPELTFLSCEGNSIKRLDLSNNKKLEHLNVLFNPLEALDVTNNELLEMIYCDYTGISKLDLTKSKELTYLRCANNEIEELDISNTKMSYLDAEKNKITKIVIGDKVFDTPDNKGIPYFYMKLNENLITEINVSKQKNLAWIEIENNRLTKLDISECERLGGVLCGGNSISELLLGKHSRMWQLHVEDNNLSGTLDISHLKDLSKGSFEGNPGLKVIRLAKNINPDATYLLAGGSVSGGKSLPCYTKDASAKWEQ